MGRKKITIEPITDERNRHVTFNKRKSGLIKKAMELSILCNCQISFLVFNAENQLFEYCSTDPRLILQQYCKVAHLPHERLSNADYSRFDKGSKGGKGGRSKKSQQVDMGNSNSIANESSDDMSQHAIKQEEMQVPHRRQSISGVSGFMDNNMAAQLMQQQYVEQQHMTQRRGYDDTSQMVQQQQQVTEQLINRAELLTPVTPNTMEQVMNYQLQQQQQPEEMSQQIGFNQVQQMMDPSQVMVMRTEAAKRKYDQVEQEEYPESKRTRHSANLAPLQVPSNPQAVPLKRVEGHSDEQAIQQHSTENWQQQTGQMGPSGEAGGEFTPLGGFLFSPIMNNLSTPMAINVGVDWNSATKKDQGST